LLIFRFYRFLGAAGIRYRTPAYLYNFLQTLYFLFVSTYKLANIAVVSQPAETRNGIKLNDEWYEQATHFDTCNIEFDRVLYNKRESISKGHRYGGRQLRTYFS
jgi:hypothetical protein